MWRLVAIHDVVSVWSGQHELRCQVIVGDERGLRVEPKADGSPKLSPPLRSGDGVVVRMSDGRFRPGIVLATGSPVLIGPVPDVDDTSASGPSTCTCPGCWRPDVPAIPPSPIRVDEGVLWGYECDECGHAWTNLDYERFLEWLDKPATSGGGGADRPWLQAESSLP